MRDSGVRWMLAFDSSCGACRAISSLVYEACDGKLEVVPLGRQDVRDRRERALGADAPWVPTLLAVDGGEGARVRAWTGPGLAVALARRLGPRSSVRVLRALGRARSESTPARGRLGRAEFLRLGGGLAVAAAVLVKGTTPAFARDRDAAAAQDWVREHTGRLPTRYDDVAALPLAHRRAVHAALPAGVRSALWVEHIDRWRATHADLTPAQARVVERARAAASRVSTFEFERGRRGTDEILRIDEAAEAAFEPAEAHALLATLGPAEAAALPDCECNTYSDKCWGSSCIWVQNSCVRSDSGCGTLWTWSCNGLCYQ
ncbi:bacteriocin fulvocin C-related protein [Streptomyces sp. NPDC050698]